MVVCVCAERQEAKEMLMKCIFGEKGAIYNLAMLFECE